MNKYNFIPLYSLSLLLITIPCRADQSHTQNFAAGQDWARGELGNLEQGMKGANLNDIPGYVGTNIPQANLDQKDLAGISAASPQVQDNEAAKLIIDSNNERQQFNIDPLTDPLFKQGDEIVNNPEKVIDAEIVEEEESSQETTETKICEESGDETLEECEETRFIDAPKLKKSIRCHVYSHGWGLGLSRNVVTGIQYDGTTKNTRAYAAGITLYDTFPAELKDRVYKIEYAQGHSSPVSLSKDGTLSIGTAGGSRSRDYGYWTEVGPYVFTIDIYYKPSNEDITEEVKSNCAYLEERVDQGLCVYEDVIDIEGPQTRIINDYVAQRDWWKRKKIYRCKYPSANDCEPLRARGCYQNSSTCKQKAGDTCVVWQQTYQCPTTKKIGKTYRGLGNTPFCLSGDCVDQSYLSNSEFADSISKLSVLKEAGEDLRNFGTIFKGLPWKCTRNCLDFRDCCTLGKGWGVSFKLASCDAAEKQLGELRQQNRCIRVGTYCAAKIPATGACWRKKTSFCCYDSKLAKIVQEQGKRQLGLGFGSPEHPECQGLTLDQLSSLDFSKIDFAELFADIAAKTKIPNTQTLVKDIQKSMVERGTLLNRDKVGPASKTSPNKIPDQIGQSSHQRTQDSQGKLLIQGRAQGDF